MEQLRIILNLTSYFSMQFAMLYTPSYWINNKLCDLDGHFQPRLSSKCIEQILIESGIIWYFEPSCLLFLALFFLQYSTEWTEMKCEMFWIILSILLNCFSGQNLFCQDEVKRHNRKNYQWNISTFCQGPTSDKHPWCLPTDYIDVEPPYLCK